MFYENALYKSTYLILIYLLTLPLEARLEAGCAVQPAVPAVAVNSTHVSN